MRLRGLAAIVIGVLLGLALLRFALVRSDPESALAHDLWPGHPAVLTAMAMRQVGLAAAKGADPPGSALADLRRLASAAPLSVEPFLVQGALAEKEGQLDRAAALYREALRRDPRSIAGHYLLSDLDLRTGRAEDGIAEIAELSRLVPASSVQLAPAIAQFARSPGAAEQLRRIFRSNPLLEEPVLTVLAGDPANAPLILSVATHPAGESGGPPAWQQKLLETMTAQGEYRQAYSVWASITGISGNGGGLFNGDFRRIAAPPPFNWSFASSDAGVAEAENGSLRVLFYGRDNATLAREIMLLPPGRYGLAVPVTVSSGSAGALAWTVTCLPARKPVLDLPLPGSGSTTASGDFQIPPQGCEAQQIELDGKMEDSPETTDLRTGPLSLQRTGA
jgi:tetratricopeptide (TPR) repeat protein